LTSTTAISSSLEKLVYGELTLDSTMEESVKLKNSGLAVEVSCDKVYFEDRPDYCDDIMAAVMGVVTVENRDRIASEWPG
jgi:hypothetical protein